ncbi:MAG: ExbD/TolR family protein [Myxococcales bacterium]|nr:ExbD/TolR family protein [Myxococcales bacterium]
MGMTGPSRDGAMMSEINVTPFVDVMLVLLVIFMITAPLMTTGVDIDLPSANTPPATLTGQELVIGMQKDGSLTLARGTGQPLPLTRAQLQANLLEEGRAHPGQPVYVQADGALPYQEVMTLLELAKLAGVPKVGLVTQPGKAE